MTDQTTGLEEQATSVSAGPAPDSEPRWPTLDELRMKHIHATISHTKNNKTKAAVLLGIDRRTLNRILTRERRKSASK